MAAEGAPVKVVTFTLLTSVVTVPALGVKYSQVSADTPAKENCCLDPQNGRFCLGRWWLWDGLGDHYEQEPQSELSALQQQNSPACS